MKKMITRIIFVCVLSLCNSQLVSANEPTTLICTQDTSTVAISGVGTSHITIQFDEIENEVFDLEQSTVGDCTGRGLFACYQDGQLMINIPASLKHVWVNLDTDDDTSNGRLGGSYDCVRIK
jgi:hypothetical protein